MDVAQKAYLEQRHNAKAWYGRGGRGRRSLKGFRFNGSELPGWTLQRVRLDEQAQPPLLRSLWSRGDAMNELLAVDVFECASVRGAHEQLLEALGNIESDAVERRTAQNAPGDVAFALADTLLVFARANVVVLLRNAGPTVVSVDEVARALDALLVQRLGR
jgi:hypothetical protein